jgi:hypothetical protein
MVAPKSRDGRHQSLLSVAHFRADIYTVAHFRAAFFPQRTIRRLDASARVVMYAALVLVIKKQVSVT